MGERTSLREKEFWLLILAGLVLFYRPLFGGETFFYRDLYLHFYPQKKRLLEFLLTGELPLWDPYLHGGQPFLADLNNAVLYPFNLIYLFLPFTFAFNLEIVLQVLICAAGSYWLARILGLGPIPSLIAGGLYGFCGYTLSLANIYHRLAAHPYIPLLLGCWHLYVREGQRKWFLLSVLLGAVQFMGGAPETSALTFLLLLGWSLAYPYQPGSIRRIAYWLLLVAFVAGVTAIQSLPTLEMIGHSNRAAGGGFYSFTGWSLHFKRLPELVLPAFFGDPHRVLQASYWGWRIEDLGYPFIVSIYFGVLPILLGFQGALARSDHSVLPRRTRFFLLMVFILSLILSMGRNLPLSHWVYEYGGVLTWFRYPVKILTIGLLPLGMLAGAGIASLLEEGRKPGKVFLYIACGVATILACATLLFYSQDLAGSFLSSYFQETGEHVRKGLQSSLLHETVFLCVGVLLLLYRLIRAHSWQYWTLAAWAICGLLLAGRLANHYAPRSFFDHEPNLADQVRKEIGEGRYFRDQTPASIVFRFPENDSAYLARWRLELLDYYTASLYSIPVIYHEDYDQLAPEKIAWLGEKMLKLPWNKRLPLLSASGVTLILSAQKLNFPEMRLLATIHNSSNTPFYLYRNQKALPPVSFVHHWRTVRTRDEAFDALTDPAFDPQQTVLIGEERSAEPPCASSVEIATLESRPTIARHHIKTTCNGYLVFTETRYPGWRVEVDGASAPVSEANLAFSAIYLEAGNHLVERRYASRSIYLGFLISLLSFLLVTLLAPKTITHSKQSQQQDSP